MAVQRSDFVYFLTASVLTCLLLAVSFFTARRDEAAHLARLARREHELRHIRLLSGKRPPDTFRQGQLVQGSVVMGCGYFRNFATILRKLFGGRLAVYDKLLERARREALVRLKEEADALGADTICNLKLQTVSLGDPTQPGGSSPGIVEVLAYGTAGNTEKAA